MTNRHPVGRLEEGLEAIRLLFATPDEVDYAGAHVTLRGVALGLRPFGDRPPPIWVAAHGPRGLAIAGRLGDGWIPLRPDPVGLRADVGGRTGQCPRGRPGSRRRDPRVLRPRPARRRRRDRPADRHVVAVAALHRPDRQRRRVRALRALHPLGADVVGLTSFVPSGISRPTLSRWRPPSRTRWFATRSSPAARRPSQHACGQSPMPVPATSRWST